MYVRNTIAVIGRASLANQPRRVRTERNDMADKIRSAKSGTPSVVFRSYRSHLTASPRLLPRMDCDRSSIAIRMIMPPAPDIPKARLAVALAVVEAGSERGGEPIWASAWPLAARAQQPAMPVIGYLGSRCPEGRLSRRNQAPAGCDDPTVAPAHDRINLSYSWHRVSARRFPDAIGSLQNRRTAIDFTDRPSLDGCRSRLRHWCGSGRDLRPLNRRRSRRARILLLR